MPQRELSDPALEEEARAGDADDDLSVIVRLTEPDVLPLGVRVVSRFGDIATVRVQRGQLNELAESASVAALEAPRKLRPSLDEADSVDAVDEDDAPPGTSDASGDTPYTRRPQGLLGTGKGAVVAVLDWGVDPAHPAFLREDGSTRLLSLWDQRAEPDGDPANRWGYGRIFTKQDIDRALNSDDPYTALGYHPADAGGRGGAHGTHVLDIAAGSGRGGGMPGVAPEADLVFVHLARTADVLGVGNLGDSASVLEALDHVFSVAGSRPCVVNMSVGAHGGPHDGSTLVEQGIDQAVALGAGRAVVNSAGNYRTRRAHTMGRVMPGETRAIPIDVPAHDPNESELELYYQRIDRFTAEVLDPSGTGLARVAPGADARLVVNGSVVGHVYHRVRHGTNGDHYIDVMFGPAAPGGRWSLRLTGDTVHDGRYHAWIERDRGLQPTFVGTDVVTSTTTGTLCNGRLSITCGCINPHGERLSLATFSSGGPTRDGRVKPEIVAPGVRIRAARSAPRGQPPGARYTRKSGTSMAAPHVTGTIALMQEASGIALDVYDIRALLFSSADARAFLDDRVPGGDLHRFGYGNLDIVAAERAARSFGEEQSRRERKPAAVEALAPELPVPPAAQALPNEALDELPDAEEHTMHEYDENESLDSGEETAELLDPGALRAALAQTGWFSDPQGLLQAAQQAIGVDPARPLEPVQRRIDPIAGARPGDVLRRMAPVPGGAYSAIVVSPQPEPWTSLVARGVPVESLRSGLFVEVVEVPLGGGPPQTMGRWLSDPTGVMPPYQTLLRGAGTLVPGIFEEDSEYAEQFVCTPARVVDPDRKGLHPTVERFRGLARKRNASVGRAQQLLNRFLPNADDPDACIDKSPAANTFIKNGLARLTVKGQNPLVVDCEFGENTELAVKMFQACAKISKDGVVGPETWAFLELIGGNPRRTLRARPCCLLAPDTLLIDNIVDPAALGTHDTSTEVNGIMYCGRAGFVDLGHVREVADLTKFLHEQLTRSGGPPQVIRTQLGLVSIRRTPADPLETAAAIAFDDAHGHEIRTWDVLTPGGRNSSFSPEDLVSNFLGTLVARRAIARMAVSPASTFSAAATIEINDLLTSLAVQTEAETLNAFNLINGRWVDFTGQFSLAANRYLLRRDFTRTPFFAGHSSDAPPPASILATFSTTALDDFDYFHIEGGKFLPRRKYDDAIKRVKKEAKAEFGNDFDKP